jgi:hypothetical protein
MAYEGYPEQHWYKSMADESAALGSARVAQEGQQRIDDPAFLPTATLTLVSGVLQRLQIDNACPTEQWGGIQWYTTDGRYVRLHVAPRMKLDWDADEFRTHDLPTNVDDINPDFSLVYNEPTGCVGRHPHRILVIRPDGIAPYPPCS